MHFYFININYIICFPTQILDTTLVSLNCLGDSTGGLNWLTNSWRDLLNNLTLKTKGDPSSLFSTSIKIFPEKKRKEHWNKRKKGTTCNKFITNIISRIVLYGFQNQQPVILQLLWNVIPFGITFQMLPK